MSDSKQPVKYQVENNGTNLTTPGNEVLRIGASPLNIKTQIAKISYNNGNKTLKRLHINKQASRLKQEDVLSEPVFRTINNTDQMRTEKKEEQVELKSLKTYLNETTNESIQKRRLPENGEQVSYKKENCFSESVPILERSKTEIIGNKLGTQSERRQKIRGGAKIRSKSCRFSETKLDEILPTVAANTKRKSYNVEEARKFLEVQKRRRRSQKVSSTLKMGNEKTNFEKQQIKKRLEELQKNSRDIITKNVYRKKCPVISQINIKNEHKKVTGDGANETKTEHSLKKKRLLNNHELSKKSTDLEDNFSSFFKGDSGNNEKSLDASKIVDESKQLDIKVSKTHKETNNIKSPYFPHLHNKRIGLLRKPETKDHSFSAIREFSVDKENIALEMMTQKLCESVPTEAKTVSNSIDLVADRKDFPDKSKEITYRKPVNKTSINYSKTKQLETADISQVNDINSIQKCGTKPHTRMDDKVETIPQNDLPNWLKRSAVHIYPYNFIMAVRRKLEALSNVKNEPSEVEMGSNRCSSMKEEQLKNSEKGEIFLLKGTDSTPSENSFLSHNIIPLSSKAVGCMPSHSENNTNLSSISIHLRSSDTVSESDSKKSESVPLTYANSKACEATSEDDTTMSSSIFNSADRNIHAINKAVRTGREELQGTISPLSLERVENLTIMSSKKLKRAIALRHVNANRGNASSNNNENATDIDFNRLLLDFNNSLSQVIEVNDRLKATINKSKEICGSLCTENFNSKQYDQYSPDFEKICSDQSIISPCENNYIHPQSTHSKGTYQILNKGEERKLERGELDLGDGDDCFKDSKAIYKYNSNSSLSSWTSNVSNEIVGPSQQELDKRLHKIRNIKEKYKQIIINLQKNRNKNDYCMGREVLCNNIEEKKWHGEGMTEEFERAESPKQPLTPENVSKKKENEIISTRVEEEENKTNTEYQQREILKPSHFMSDKKNPIISLRSQRNPNHHFAAKNISSSRKILEMFDNMHLEISMGSTNNETLSDSTCSYSNVGVYEKLIRNETIKSEHLTALIKMKERALYDRTKGQIAWLEVQKEQCKSKGLLLQIATIKKKQRGILLKMEKERDEIKRLLQATTTTNSTESTSNREIKELVSPIEKTKISVVSQQANSKLCHKFTQPCRKDKRLSLESATVDEYSNPRSDPVVRANYDLGSSRSLEDLLRKREIYLQRRREHVERLIQWHRRLDREEAEVLQMENELHKIQSKTGKEYQHHSSVVPVNNHTHTKAQRRINEIENSLRLLNNISSTSTGCTDISERPEGIECVHITGVKLNKLWRRLTSQHCEKYEPNKYYNLSKSDLESLYEAAKVAVLHDFSNHEGGLAGDFLENSLLEHNNVVSSTFPNTERGTSIPSLNLCTSSEPSDKEVSCEETSPHSVSIGKYSPSSAAESLNRFPENSNTSTNCSTVTELSPDGNSLPKDNGLVVNGDTIMRSSSSNTGQLLARSLSDSILYKNHHLTLIKENDIINGDKCTSQDDTKSFKSNITNVREFNELSTSTGLNPPNVCEGIDGEVFVETSQKLEIKGMLPTSSEEKVFPSSSRKNSTSLPSSNYSELKSKECKTSSFMDKLQNEDCTLTSNINDVIKEESSSDQNSLNSKTFICEENLMETDAISNKDLTSKIYQEDFENNTELTQLNDVSFPYFESIVDLSPPEAIDDAQNVKDNINVIEEMSILSDVSEMPEKSQSQKSNIELVSAPPQQPTSSDNANSQTQQISNGSIPVTSSTGTVQLMPDIINELEIHRCQQILLETEQFIHFDNTSTLPYMYVREIPNKPPPPYVPPAHGSPMTTIFPSQERIKEISYRRTHELYCELLKTEYVSECGKKLPSVMDEQITNIYERIILDICREYLDEHSEVLTQGDPVNFHNKLAFFNPPNRLQCIQDSVYKEVRRCLAMNKDVKRRTPVYSVYGQRANSDHIGKIIIQEMYDEDDKWCNFHREENEVIELIIYEIIGKYVCNIAKEVLDEESGFIEDTIRDEAKTNENINSCVDTSDQPNDSEEMPISQEF